MLEMILSVANDYACCVHHLYLFVYTQSVYSHDIKDFFLSKKFHLSFVYSVQGLQPNLLVQPIFQLEYNSIKYLMEYESLCEIVRYFGFANDNNIYIYI